MADKTERMTAEQFRNRTTVALAGQRNGFTTQPVTPRPSLPAPAPRAVAQWYIGIDPGKNTGFALWQGKTYGVPGQFLEVSTLTFWATIRRLEKLVREFGAGALHIRIEDVRANKPTFSDKAGNAAVRENISQKVGSNKRDCQLLIEWIEDAGIPYTALPPRKRATGKGKVTAEFFKGVKGFPARSTEHSRDASALVVGL